MFYGGEVCWSMVGSQAALVIAEDHIQHPMEAVLDGPMVADEWSDQASNENQRSNVEARLAFDLAASLTGTRPSVTLPTPQNSAGSVRHRGWRGYRPDDHALARLHERDETGARDQASCQQSGRCR